MESCKNTEVLRKKQLSDKKYPKSTLMCIYTVSFLYSHVERNMNALTVTTFWSRVCREGCRKGKNVRRSVCVGRVARATSRVQCRRQGRESLSSEEERCVGH